VPQTTPSLVPRNHITAILDDRVKSAIPVCRKSSTVPSATRLSAGRTLNPVEFFRHTGIDFRGSSSIAVIWFLGTNEGVV